MRSLSRSRPLDLVGLNSHPKFSSISESLLSSQDDIVREYLDAQGDPVDVGGYYRPVDSMAESIMRPSSTFNAIIDKL